MFTGIIEATAPIASLAKKNKGMTISIPTPKGWKLKLGDSVNISGVCSTVKNTGRVLEFFYMPETLAKSNVGDLKKGYLVNLERSLPAFGRLDGHIVQGHVDVCAKITSIKHSGDSVILTVVIPSAQKSFMKYLAPKGSVSVEGISLTVVNIDKQNFTVHLIPHTMQATNLHTKRVGDKVNLEFDVLAKYLERLIKVK